jgi:hypothetical protein
MINATRYPAAPSTVDYYRSIKPKTMPRTAFLGAAFQGSSKYEPDVFIGKEKSEEPELGTLTVICTSPKEDKKNRKDSEGSMGPLVRLLDGYLKLLN